ncbi:MAG: flagellin lysine-N-methylase [Selenomonadaceae bacterium]|nr:flagellin lysine-N-methylase [Selenomonadaceae bacterium]
MDADALYQMKVYRPNYVGAFKCDGKACESRCCRDWRIVLDEQTRQKYLTSPAAKEILSHVDETGQAFQMQSSGACPFLDENFLCKLQLKHGEEFLTAICQSFPRVTYKLDAEIYSQAMTLTCPVAAILILLRNEPIAFEVVDELKARQVFDFTEKLSMPAEEFIHRQRAAIKILQRRELSINQRLEELCKFFGEKISVPVDFDAMNHAAALAEVFGKMYEANLTISKKNQLAEVYLTHRKNILAQLRGSFAVVLENYLVNEFVMRNYPCAFVGDEAFNCRVFVTAYRAIEFAAVLTAIAKRRLTVEDFLELLLSLNDKMDHSRGGMTAIKTFAELHDAEVFYSMMLER